MARTLNGSTQFGSVGTSPVTGYPCTMACWAKLTSTGTVRIAMNVNRLNDSTNFHYFSLGCDTSNPPKAIVSINGTASGASETTITTTATFATATWTHLCGVFASTSDCRVYINGANKVSGTTPNTPTGLGRFTVGAWKRRAADSFNQWPGQVALWAVWSAALSDDLVAALGKGYHPKQIAPESLVDGSEWWGNIGTEPSWKRLYDMDMSATSKADGPPILFPSQTISYADYHVTAPAAATGRLVGPGNAVAGKLLTGLAG